MWRFVDIGITNKGSKMLWYSEYSVFWKNIVTAVSLWFVLVLTLSLFPGAYYRGFIQTYFGKLSQQVQVLLSKVKSKPVKADWEDDRLCVDSLTVAFNNVYSLFPPNTIILCKMFSKIESKTIEHHYNLYCMW